MSVREVMQSIVDAAADAPPSDPVDGDATPVEDAGDATVVDQTDDQPADETAPADDATPETEDAAEDADAPPAPADAPADADPALPFTVEGADPKLLAAAKITLTVDGKTKTLTVPEIARLAQSEPAAQRGKREAENRLAQLERDAAAREETFGQEWTEARDFALRLLNDDDFLLAQRQKLQDYEAPEARAKRAEDRADALARQREDERRAADRQARAQSFYMDELTPALDAIKSAAPEVSDEEILGQFNLLTADYLVNGVIAPEHYDRVADAVTGKLTQWAKTRHAERTAKIDAANAREAAARQKAQAAKNASVRGLKPVGAGATGPAKKSTPPPKDAAEAKAQIMAGFRSAVA